MIKRLFFSTMALFLLLLLPACAKQTGQVIGGDPRAYLLQIVDLPAASTYFMPENEAFLIPNAAAIGAFGQEKGQALIDETQRVSSARVHFQRAEEKKPGPAYYVATVTLHQSAQGARTAVEKYNIAKMYPDGGWTVVKDPPAVGDLTIAETGQAANPSGQKVFNYRIEFAYRNASVDMLVAGLEKDVSLETAAKAARAVLTRLQTAPLTTPPLPTMVPASISN